MLKKSVYLFVSTCAFFVLFLMSFAGLYGQSLTDVTNLDGTISAQYTDSPSGEDYNNLIDKNTETKYLTFHGQGWIQFNAPEKYVVTKYTVTSANDSPERDPASWTLKASNDLANWVTIDSRSGQSFDNRFQKKEYTFTNNSAYTAYRLYMTCKSGSTLQLSEWELFGVSESGTPGLEDITNYGGTASAQYNDTNYGPENLIDNLPATKYVTSHTVAWIQYKSEYPNSYIVSKYTITAADNIPSSDPRDWTFEGSNDNNNWTVLDTQSGQIFPSRGGVLKFTFSNSTQYKYYRLNISAVAGGTALQIAELKLFGVKGADSNLPYADFKADKTLITGGESVTFTNTSENAASYSWSFPGGTPSSSTEKNPVVQYNTDGTYDVSLTVSDGTNTDQITHAGYISVVVIDKAQIAEDIKQEFLLCWNSYKKYAMGYDELQPISKSGSNWYSSPFYMTPVDALDTMILMGLKDEADEDRQYIDENLSFDKDIFVSNFEFTIRFLGGLISSYQLTGDQKLLDLAKDLADRELHAFDSQTGMPYGDINLKTGAVRRNVTNPAEIGTLLIEFGALSKITGDDKYYNTAKKALQKLYSLTSSIGLVGNAIDVNTGSWVGTDCSISGGIDSYYEYLLKCSILFDDKDCRNMWDNTIVAINKYLEDDSYGGLWYGHANMNTGSRNATQFGSLDAFFGGTLVLAGDLERAKKLEESCFSMWNRYGIEPEQYDYSTNSAVSAGYYLRPEIVESAFYLYRATKDPHYLLMGKVFFDGLKKYCRTDNGYVQLGSVISKEKIDGMPSYFLAETMKYLYLIFAPEETLDLSKVVINTEAHPIQKTWAPDKVGKTDELPNKFNLYQNYPNPFNPETVVKFSLPKASHVVIKVYNSLGQYLKTLTDTDMSAGDHKVEFFPKGLSSGVYFYQIKAGDYLASNKMVYLK